MAVSYGMAFRMVSMQPKVLDRNYVVAGMTVSERKDVVESRPHCLCNRESCPSTEVVAVDGGMLDLLPAQPVLMTSSVFGPAKTATRLPVNAVWSLFDHSTE